MSDQIPLFNPITDDLLFIGSLHLLASELTPEIAARMDELREQVSLLDVLAIEGTQDAYDFAVFIDDAVLERAAIAASPAVAYLDKGIDYVAVGEKYGVSGVLQGVLSLNPMTKSGKSPRQKMLNSQRSLEVKRSQANFRTLPVEQIEKALPELILLYDQDQVVRERYFELTRMFARFKAPIRDHEIYVPRILKLMGHPGKLGVMVGIDHVDNILRKLAGQGEEPQHWQDYVAQLPEPSQEAIRKIHDVVRRYEE